MMVCSSTIWLLLLRIFTLGPNEASETDDPVHILLVGNPNKLQKEVTPGHTAVHCLFGFLL